MADRRELLNGGFGTVREVRIAVAELLGEVELEPLREHRAPLRGGAVEGEALEHLLGRAKVALPVPAPLGLAALERGPAADRDEDVLQERAPRMVRVDVAGRDGLHAEVLGEVAQKAEPTCVSSLERPLELDEEALAAEGAREASGRVRVEQPETASCAAREADEAVVQLGHRSASPTLEGAEVSRPSASSRRLLHARS